MRQELTDKQIEYIELHLSIFDTSGTVEQVIRNDIYNIYNHITGLKKKPNSCGRCWRNVKTEVYNQYKKQTLY